MNEHSTFQYLDQLDDLPGHRKEDLLPSMGHARCYGCHRPGWYIRWADGSDAVGHAVPYRELGSALALCEPCWRGSSIEQRVEAYQWLAWQWTKWGWGGEEQYRVVWPAMRMAIYVESAG